MINDYRQIIAGMKGTRWLILEESLEVIVKIVNKRLSGEQFTDEEIKARLEAAADEKRDNPRVQLGGGVGVLSMYGPMFPKANLMTEVSGATSLETFRNDLQELADDDSIRQIILDMDTPGGAADMVPETGRFIRDIAQQKPVYALANTLAASAGLWLGSQATKFYSTESGRVGSLGVYHIVEDRSERDKAQGTKISFISAGKFKTAGNQHEPLSKEAEEYIQAHVDEIHGEFIDAVAEGRGLTPGYVKETFGDAKVHSAKKAAEIKMTDGVKDLDTLLSELVTENYQSQSTTERGALANAVKRMHNNNGGELLSAVSTEQFSEPGEVKDDPDLNRDDGADQGWRRETPPAGDDDSIPNRSETVTKPNKGSPNLIEGGESDLTDEQVQELRTLLGLDEGADLVAAITAMQESISTMTDELAPLRELKAETESQKKFAVEYPQEAKRLAELEEERQRNFAKQFSASFEDRRVTRKTGEADEETEEATTLGFSARVLDEIQLCAKEYSEGTPTVEQFKSCLDAIFDNGIVDYGNRGSSRESDELEAEVPGNDSKTNRQKFHDVVKDIAEKDNLTFEAALVEGAKRHPKLAEAWRQAPVMQGS